MVKINITKHAFDRYAERILGYTDQFAARQYVNANEEKVTEDINKLFSFSTLLWTGQINGDKSTKNYYLKDNIILVTDTSNTALITLYRIDFGFSNEIDRIISEKLLEEILELQNKLSERKMAVAETAEIKKAELSNIESELFILKNQVKLLEFKRQAKDSEIKVLFNDVEIVSKQIEVKALKLCNSLEYKKELLALTK